MGHVYLGQDLLLERAVAIKFIAAAEPHEVLREKFAAEGRALARLAHPNVVAVHRVSQVDGHAYLVSEYVRGQSLDALSRPMPWDKVLRIGIGLARGLAAVHRRGVLHRDVKPANAVLAEDGEVKLIDFGLAKVGVTDVETPSSPSAVPVPSGREMGSNSAALARATLGLTNRQPGDEPEGTPLYMAPEVRGGAPASRRSDLYSLGAVLYELCAGHPPRLSPEEERIPPLEEKVLGANPRLCAVVDRCLESNPERRYASADEVLDALEQVAPTSRAVALPPGNPYRGLRPFDREHRALFFGRDADVRAVLERLRTDALVVVAGESGVGKSSLCRAGVLPFIAESALDGTTWTVVRLVPGREPLLHLAAALAPALRMDSEALTAWLRAEPAALPRAVLRARQTQSDLALLVFVDQAEELLSVAPPDEAAHFAQCCAAALSLAPAMRWLMTVRGDFLTRLAALPILGEEVQRSLYVLRPLSPERLREAIVGPARSLGVSFESEAMVETLVSAGEAPAGSLPLIQFALAELWEARDERQARIPAAALEAMGGVAGALARHADGVLQRMLPAEREEARRLLLRLVNPDGTRVSRGVEELGGREPKAASALEALVAGRLVVARDRAGETQYELAHESLPRNWPTLSAWIDANSEHSRVRQRLVEAAAEWERLGHSRDVLWHRRQLSEARRLNVTPLNPTEQDFLRASRWYLQLQRLLPLGAVALLLGMLLLAAVVARARAQATLRARVAAYEEQAVGAAEQARAAAAAAGAKRDEALRLFDGTWRTPASPQPVTADVRWDEAEAVWSEALALAQRAQSGLAQATSFLELGMLLAPERKELRERLAELLFEQLQQSERWGRPGPGLKERILSFDPGRFRGSVDAPGRLLVAVAPGPAEVQVERYVPSGLLLRPAVIATALPGVELPLEAGSYRLVIRRPGEPPFYDPFLVHPGEPKRIELRLPPPGSVPSGFVYIPPGKFLAGSADDEGLRMVQTAAPLHEVETGGYLIGVSEVTFREWIEYLEVRGPEGHSSYPNVESTKGLVRLERPSGRWTLRLRPTSKDYVARWGEPIHYEGRQRLSIQDWREFPVSGVSLVDIQGYLAWLDRSGRVPGARLCTDWEWERAARGADGRPFTTGNTLLASAANVDATYGRAPVAFGPDQVGAHPESDSPFGIHDLAGNALEMVAPALPDQAASGRGGSWYFDVPLSARVTSHEPLEPQTRAVYLGFRVCASRDPR